MPDSPFIDRVIVGDCRTSLRNMPDESVDCVVTSPPYFRLRTYGVGEENGEIGRETTLSGYIANLVEIFREVRRVLKSSGTFWLNLGDSYSNRLEKNDRLLPPKNLIGIPWRVAFACQDDGWILRQDIVWAKGISGEACAFGWSGNPMPESVVDRCATSHEYVFLFSKSQRYFFDRDAISEDAVTKPAVRDKASEGWCDGCGITQVSPGQRIWGGTRRNRRSVWTISTKHFNGAHFAVFPTQLAELCVSAGCPSGGTVLDPFAGSGTVAVVAKRQGKRFVALELNPEYGALIGKRLAETSKNQ